MTPDLMRAGADARRAAEEPRSRDGRHVGRPQASYSRVAAGELDIAHGAILYLDDITVSFDGFKALNDAVALDRAPASCAASSARTAPARRR